MTRKVRANLQSGRKTREHLRDLGRAPFISQLGKRRDEFFYDVQSADADRQPVRLPGHAGLSSTKTAAKGGKCLWVNCQQFANKLI